MNRHRRAFITAAILVAASGVVAGTSASYTALTQNTATSISVDAMYGPSGTMTSANSGLNVVFTWTGFTRGGFQSNSATTTNLTHRVLGTDAAAETGGDGILNGNNPPTCTKDPDDYPNVLATSSSATATTATGSNVANQATNAGGFICTLLVANRGNFYSKGDVPASSNISLAVQLGHVIKSVVVANGGSAGTMDSGDTITITFLQAVAATTGNRPTSTNRTNTMASTSGNSICANAAADLITIARAAASGACANPEPTTFIVGQIAGLSINQTGTFNASYAWNGTSTVLTVTVRGKTDGSSPTSLTGLAGTFNPTTQAALKSTTGTVSICTTANTATSVCKPAVTGSF